MQKQLERNIRLYGYLKIFTKRVYLPVITIYLLQVGHLSIKQLALLASLSAIISTIADVPTGYFADRIGRRTALMVAACLAIVASLLYACMPTMSGAIAAVALESLAYSFLSGASEALMHDTLKHLNRVDDYPKIVGRAQSFSLGINTVFVALVPLSYRIDPKLPFIFGTFAFALLLFIGARMHEPPRDRTGQHSFRKDFWPSVRYFVTRKSFVMFLSIGLLAGLIFGSSDFVNLTFNRMGLKPEHFGFVYAFGSIVGIVGGFFIHHFKNISLRLYTFIDLLIFVCYFAAIGLTKNLAVAIVGFGIYMGFFRLRNILYQYHLLIIFQKSEYKATLISVLSAFGRPNEIWVPFMFVGATSTFGFYQGFNIIAAASLLIITPLIFLGARLLRADSATVAKDHI